MACALHITILSVAPLIFCFDQTSDFSVPISMLPTSMGLVIRIRVVKAPRTPNYMVSPVIPRFPTVLFFFWGSIQNVDTLQLFRSGKALVRSLCWPPGENDMTDFPSESRLLGHGNTPRWGVIQPRQGRPGTGSPEPRTPLRSFHQ